MSIDLWGHVHEDGNPHFILDPYNVIKIAEVIMLKLSSIDEKNHIFYKNNFDKFKKDWEKKIKTV